MSDLPSWARVGAKVVCIVQCTNPVTLRHNYPRKGEAYTVRAVVFHSLSGNPLFLLDEAVNSTWEVDGAREPGFPVSGFRPLVSQSDDIALFTHHLDSVRNTEHA